MTTSNPQFSVSNGQIIGPDGKPFVARGINMFLDQVDAPTVMSTFPGINAVRLATTPGADLNSIDALVKGLTAQGVVVLIEDHSSSGGNPNTSSGQALIDETNWYAGLASKYQANPYVWFGTANEPDNTANLSAVPNQERAIYDAIRGTGSNAMVMMEMRGGFTNDAAQASASTYATMTNVAWDTHYYGWVTNQSTDMATINQGLTAQIADAQSVRSADGVMPVVIGEYGPSSSGIAGYDSNGLQVVQAVDSSGYGTFAWAYNAGTDALTNGSSLTDFGTLVAQHIAAGGTTPIPPVTPPVVIPPVVIPPVVIPPVVIPPVVVPPPVTAGSDTLVVNLSEDAYLGNAQARITLDGKTLVAAQTVTALHGSGQTGAFTFHGNFGSGAHTVGVSFLNDAYGGSAATDRNLYIDSASFDGNAIGKPAALYSAGTVNLAVPAAAPPAGDTLDLAIAEDAWNGDAQYTVSVDGTQVGGTRTAHALHSGGTDEHVLVTGQWGGGAHTVTLAFINDAYGGSATTDRNLYLDGISYDGKAAANATHTFGNNEAVSFAVGGSTPPPATGTVTLHLNEDAYKGDAQFQVTLDGKALGGGTVTALHSAGKLQDFAFSGIAPGQHQLGVTFTNDLYAGTPSTDRNLYVGSIDYAGHSTPGAALMSAGTHNFTIG